MWHEEICLLLEMNVSQRHVLLFVALTELHCVTSCEVLLTPLML